MMETAQASPSPKVDRGVPIPAAKRGPPTDRPWATMEVGDSFFAKTPEGITRRQFQQRLGTYGTRRLPNSNRRFSTRAEGDGVRVWRIS